jgi:hypothetical protein
MMTLHSGQRRKSLRRVLINVVLNIKGVTMDIYIDGLSKRQRVLADVMWALDTTDDVMNFITSLPEDQQAEARTVMSMMVWAMLDTVQDTNLAYEVLQKYL